MTSGLDPEELLRCEPFVRGLARCLLVDDHAVDDVVQQTFAAALAAPPARGALPAWLGTVVRRTIGKRIRGERRRQQRERAAARAEAVPSTAEFLAREQARAAVVQAVLQLDDTYREVVVLRWFEGHAPGAIAGLLGVPVETVRTRHRRALEQLRARLDRTHGRAAWAALLVPLAPRTGAAGATATATTALSGGVLLMTMKAKVALLAALSLTAGIALWQVAAAPATVPDAVRTRAAVETAGAGGPATHPEGNVADDGSQAAAAASAQRALVAAPTAMVFGRVVDARNGAPIADAALTLHDFATGVASTAHSGADGGYEFEESRGSTGMFQLAIEKPGYGRLVAAAIAASTEPRRDELAPGLALRGRVVEGDGRPVPAFRVQACRLWFQQEGEMDSSLALFRQAVPEDQRVDRALDVADPTGEFCLRDLAAGNYALVVTAPGRQPQFYNGGGRSYDLYRGVAAQPETAAPLVTIELPAAGLAIVEVVERATGLPVRGASVATVGEVGRSRVSFTTARVAATAANRFEVPVALDKRGCIDGLEVRVTAPGYAPIRVSPSGQENGYTYVVELGRPATVKGRVLDAAGHPLAGAVVLIEREADGGLLGSAITAGDGCYEIGGLDAPSAEVLHCLQPALGSVLATMPLQLADGETKVVDVGAGSDRIVGRVSLLGTPKQRALVFLDRGALRLFCWTRGDGVFAFAGLAAGPCTVSVSTEAHGRNLRAEREVDFTGGERQVDFDFTHRVTGVVKVVGEPLALAKERSVEVVARRRDAAGSSDRIEVGDDGRFELLVAGPGVYELEVDGGEDWVALTRRTVDLRADLADAPAEVELQIARDRHEGRIELHVVDQATGAPASGSLEWSWPRGFGAGVLEDGHFVETDLPIGRYRYTVQTDEHRPVTIEFDLTPQQPVVERRIALEPAQAVEVTEVEAGGAAHRAGIRAGDLLRRYGATAIHSVAALHAAIAANRAVVIIVVEHDGLERALTADPGLLGVEVANVR